MTIIHPSKNQYLLSRMLIVLILGAVCSALILVVLYNRYINLNHNISAVRSEIQRIRFRVYGLEKEIVTKF